MARTRDPDAALGALAPRLRELTARDWRAIAAGWEAVDAHPREREACRAAARLVAEVAARAGRADVARHAYAAAESLAERHIAAALTEQGVSQFAARTRTELAAAAVANAARLLVVVELVPAAAVEAIWRPLAGVIEPPVVPEVVDAGAPDSPPAPASDGSEPVRSPGTVSRRTGRTAVLAAGSSALVLHLRRRQRTTAERDQET